MTPSTFSVSAATIYKTADGAVLFTGIDENADRVFESYEGSFPNTDNDGNALTWYITSTATEGSDTVHTVASFLTLDQTGEHASLSDTGVYKYVNQAKELSIVSVYFPNDSGILTLNLSDSGYGNTYDFKTDTSNILFARLPNTLTVFPSRFGQSTPMIDCTIDENAPFTSMGVTVFYKSQNLRSVDIPKNVEIIYSNGHSNDGYPFYQCINLIDVDFAEGSKLHTIEQNSFNSCYALKEITIPNSVVNLGNNVFMYCKGLETIRLGANAGKDLETYNVQSMLYGCSSLKYVYMSDTMIPTTGSHLFDSGASSMVIFYTGDYKQYEALKAILTTLKNNGKFINATPIEYDSANDDQYYKDLATNDKKNYVVYGYNTCKAFYDDNHIGTEIINYVDYDSEGNKIEGKQFLTNAELCVECTRCHSSKINETLAPLFTSMGFSYNDNAVMQGFAVNYDVLDDYEEYYGNDISFGLACAVKEKAVDGKILECASKATVDYTEKAFDIFEMKLSGIGTDAYMNTELFICAYVIMGKDTYYISNGEIAQSALGFEFSYSSIVE